VVVEVDEAGTYSFCVSGVWCGMEGDSECCTVEVSEDECPTAVTFTRGDANSDGAEDIGDAICILGFLFGPPDDPCKAKVGACEDAGDANDDGAVDIGDAIKLLSRLFASDPALPPPSLPDSPCGSDPTEDDIGCDEFPACSR
jgi:hypothetical protein